MDYIDKKKVINFLIYLCICYKLIDRGLKKCVFYDAIISIDKAMTGNIHYKRNVHVIWGNVIEKAVLDCNNDKNVLNFLIYVFVISS